MRRIEIAKILRNESDFLAKYFLSKLSEISNFNTHRNSDPEFKIFGGFSHFALQGIYQLKLFNFSRILLVKQTKGQNHKQTDRLNNMQILLEQFWLKIQIPVYFTHTYPSTSLCSSTGLRSLPRNSQKQILISVFFFIYES